MDAMEASRGLLVGLVAGLGLVIAVGLGGMLLLYSAVADIAPYKFDLPGSRGTLPPSMASTWLNRRLNWRSTWAGRRPRSSLDAATSGSSGTGTRMATQPASKRLIDQPIAL